MEAELQEIANSVAYLASAKVIYINGMGYMVDGGVTVGPFIGGL